MNKLFFTGRAAAAPELKTYRDKPVARLRLIRNEYAGRTDDGERREIEVSIDFTAFGPKAEALSKAVMKGDQVMIEAEVRNNNYTDAENVERYGFNFQIAEFELGAPGPAKREKLAAAQ